MKTSERLIFVDGEWPAGTPCDRPAPTEAAALASRWKTMRGQFAAGELQVVRLAGRLRIVDAAAVEGSGVA